jgi:hypothetical protein
MIASDRHVNPKSHQKCPHATQGTSNTTNMCTPRDDCMHVHRLGAPPWTVRRNQCTTDINMKTKGHTHVRNKLTSSIYRLSDLHITFTDSTESPCIQPTHSVTSTSSSDYFHAQDMHIHVVEPTIIRYFLPTFPSLSPPILPRCREMRAQHVTPWLGKRAGKLTRDARRGRCTPGNFGGSKQTASAQAPSYQPQAVPIEKPAVHEKGLPKSLRHIVPSGIPTREARVIPCRARKKPDQGGRGIPTHVVRTPWQQTRAILSCCYVTHVTHVDPCSSVQNKEQGFSSTQTCQSLITPSKPSAPCGWTHAMIFSTCVPEKSAKLFHTFWALLGAEKPFARRASFKPCSLCRYQNSGKS